MPDNYAELLKREDCLLLLVDFQKPVIDLCVEPDVMLKNAAALIEIADIFNVPIILSEQNADKLGRTMPQVLEKVQEPRVFNKIEFSCFQNEAISRAVQESERRTLLICGVVTHVCIFQTAADALRMGYRVHIAADAVSSQSLFNREIGLRRLERWGAVISSTEMIIYELLNRADSSEFKRALPLLKTL
ncbi:MAG: isochorismatase family protein [Syntrophobacteraceae bacterium]